MFDIVIVLCKAEFLKFISSVRLVRTPSFLLHRFYLVCSVL